MALDIYTVQWEYEDQLPEDITDLEYDLVFPMSKVDIVRLFPYIEVYDKDGNSKRCWIGV